MTRGATFDLVVDPGSLARSDRGQVSGKIYVVIDGDAFPEREWSDSVVPVLLAWADAISSLRSGAASVGIRFLDGPYRVDVIPATTTHWRLSGITSAPEDRMATSADVEWQVIQEVLCETLTRFLEEAGERGWWSPDIDRLVLAREQVCSGG